MKCQYCNYSKLATSHLKTHMMEAHGVGKKKIPYFLSEIAGRNTFLKWFKFLHIFFHQKA